MGCEWGELLDLIKTVGSVETTIADIKVRVVSANRYPEQQPKGTGRCLLEQVINDSLGSDSWKIDPEKGVLCEWCGMRIRAVVEKAPGVKGKQGRR